MGLLLAELGAMEKWFAAYTEENTKRPDPI
jgi:hypothetical protein